MTPTEPKTIIDKIKEETQGKFKLDAEWIRKDREHRLAIDCRVASALGRPITDKEYLSSNI